MSKAEFILGTVQFGLAYGIQNSVSGHRVSQETSQKVLECAQKIGIRTLDTANDYGEAQKVIGTYTRRNDFQILSKFRTRDPQRSLIGCWRQTESELRVAEVDCYSFHRVNEARDPEVWADLTRLLEEGKVKRIGVSVYTNEELEFAVQHPRISVIQLPYNILDNWRRRGASLLRARDAGKVLHARSVYLQGLLLMEPDRIPSHLRSAVSAIQKIDQVARREKLSRAALCLAYVLSRDVFDGVVIGVDDDNQLARNFEDFKEASSRARDLSDLDALDVQNDDILNPARWSALSAT